MFIYVVGRRFVVSKFLMYLFARQLNACVRIQPLAFRVSRGDGASRGEKLVSALWAVILHSCGRTRDGFAAFSWRWFCRPVDWFCCGSGELSKTNGTIVDPILDVFGSPHSYRRSNLKPNAHLAGANLSNAILTRADLYKTNLTAQNQHRQPLLLREHSTTCWLRPRRPRLDLVTLLRLYPRRCL